MGRERSGKVARTVAVGNHCIVMFESGQGSVIEAHGELPDVTRKWRRTSIKGGLGGGAGIEQSVCMRVKARKRE